MSEWLKRQTSNLLAWVRIWLRTIDICSGRTTTFSKTQIQHDVKNHKPVVGNGCPHPALGYDANPVFRALNGDVKVRGVMSLRRKRKPKGFLAVPT